MTLGHIAWPLTMLSKALNDSFAWTFTEIVGIVTGAFVVWTNQSPFVFGLLVSYFLGILAAFPVINGRYNSSSLFWALILGGFNLGMIGMWIFGLFVRF